MLAIVFFCVSFIILGIIFSEIKIDIKKIELNISKANFDIKIGIYLFGFLKVFGIRCDKNGIKFLGKNFSYKKLFKLSFKEIILKNLKKKDIKIAEELKFKINLAKFTIRVGVKDMFVTVFLVTLISSLIAIFIKDKIQKANINKINYKILPEFNKLEFYYEGNINISIKTINIKNIILKKKLKVINVN